jgi:hypothetical protein
LLEYFPGCIVEGGIPPVSAFTGGRPLPEWVP